MHTGTTTGDTGYTHSPEDQVLMRPVGVKFHLAQMQVLQVSDAQDFIVFHDFIVND